MAMPNSAVLDDRSVLMLSGPQAREFLQGLVTSDLQRLDAEPALYAGLLSPQGKLLFDFFIVRGGPENLYLDCAKDRSADLLKRLTLYRLRSKVGIAAPEFGVAVQWDGEDGAALAPDAIAYPDPRLAEMGRRIIAPHAALEALAGSTEAYHAHRIALGVPDSADLPPDSVFPLDAGFEELNGVSFKKGCYVGQEVTSRMKHRSSARKRFFLVEGENELTQGASLQASGRELGTIASVVGRRALALVRLDRVADARQSGDEITADGNRVALTPPLWLKISGSG
jgi:folate-binding protein YgfZ